MAKRRRADVKTTLLCATKFWAAGKGSAPTFRLGVRKVVLKQGFTPAEINRAERAVIREGKLVKAGRLIQLTSKGQATRCGSVKLAPWTDDPYPGASLSGRARDGRPRAGRARFGSADSFEEWKARRALLEKEVVAASEDLQVFPRSPMGLVPDTVKSTPEYQAAKTRFQKAFARQREFNAVFTKKFAKELRAGRRR